MMFPLMGLTFMQPTAVLFYHLPVSWSQYTVDVILEMSPEYMYVFVVYKC